MRPGTAEDGARLTSRFHGVFCYYNEKKEANSIELREAVATHRRAALAAACLFVNIGHNLIAHL